MSEETKEQGPTEEDLAPFEDPSKWQFWRPNSTMRFKNRKTVFAHGDVCDPKKGWTPEKCFKHREKLRLIPVVADEEE